MSLQHVLNIQELEPLARKRLPAGVYGFIAGGAQDGLTLANNREALARVRLIPRGLVDIAQRSQDVTLFGHNFASPFGIAPMGIAGIASFEADISMARAASRMNLPFVLSNMSTVPMERVARSCDSVKWLQVYMLRDRERASRFIRRASDAGYQALLVTMDVPVMANRENNQRSGFTLPFRMNPRIVFDGLMHPRWLCAVLARTLIATGVPQLENSASFERPSILASGNPELRSRGDVIDWRFMRWLREQWRLPLLVKGVLHPADALQAVACGLDGIVVSNHGGRQLDGAVSPIDVLPQFSAAVGGEEGVLHALNILRTEVDRDLALMGCTGMASLLPDSVEVFQRI